MKYLLLKVQEHERAGSHEFCEFSIAENFNGKPGNFIASLVPCHKGSEELEKDATEIVKNLSAIDDLTARIAELEAALKNLVDMCLEHPAVYDGSTPIIQATKLLKG